MIKIQYGNTTKLLKMLQNINRANTQYWRQQTLLSIKSVRNTWSMFTESLEKLPQEIPIFKDLRENQLIAQPQRDSEP